MTWIKRIFIFLLIALIFIQFIKPNKNEGGYEDLQFFIEETKPTHQVQVILKSACYDCHSNQTNYPWYNKVAPISFWLADHVKEGKRHLNFSDWERYSLEKRDHKLDELVEEVEQEEMPLESYTWIHEGAKLSPEDRETLLLWAKTARLNYSAVR